MKTCSKCKEPTSAEEFTKNRSSPDGLGYHCKACHREVAKAYRLANPDKVKASSKAFRLANPEKIKRERLAWREANPDKCKSNREAWKKSNPEKVKRSRSAWETANPEKRRAHWLTEKAIKRGKLTRQPCIVCGEIQTHAHHVAYDLPLAVSWLCAQHHRDAHSLHREVGK